MARLRERNRNETCVLQTERPFTSREAPPYWASKCRGHIKKGNDGQLWISEFNTDDENPLKRNNWAWRRLEPTPDYATVGLIDRYGTVSGPKQRNLFVEPSPFVQQQKLKQEDKKPGKRGPTAYNQFIKRERRRIHRESPELSKQQVFNLALSLVFFFSFFFYFFQFFFY